MFKFGIKTRRIFENDDRVKSSMKYTFCYSFKNALSFYNREKQDGELKFFYISQKEKNKNKFKASISDLYHLDFYSIQIFTIRHHSIGYKPTTMKRKIKYTTPTIRGKIKD